MGVGDVGCWSAGENGIGYDNMAALASRDYGVTTTNAGYEHSVVIWHGRPWLVHLYSTIAEFVLDLHERPIMFENPTNFQDKE